MRCIRLCVNMRYQLRQSTDLVCSAMAVRFRGTVSGRPLADGPGRSPGSVHVLVSIVSEPFGFAGAGAADLAIVRVALECMIDWVTPRRRVWRLVAATA